MSSWIEQKYISMVGIRLRNFKRKNSNTWNFSCPMCGDSQKHKNKARGYIYTFKNKYQFHCHNCETTMGFNKFLKFIDNNLHNEYLHDQLVDNGKENEADEFKDRLTPARFEKNQNPLSKYKKISQLKYDHPAKKYIDSRYIPTDLHHGMYWVNDFKKFVNTIVPQKFANVDFDEGRVVFPFINSHGVMYGLQGRSLIPDDAIRYITIMFDENEPRLYGIDKVDLSKNVYVFEGPIDSMFIKNSIASCGGEIFRELNQIDLDKALVTIVYDNEPRHNDTIKKMNRAIKLGYKVCFWPDTVHEKDINQMVCNHFKGKEHIPTELIYEYGELIRDTIDKCSLSNIIAELEMAKWHKSNVVRKRL